VADQTPDGAAAREMASSPAPRNRDKRVYFIALATGDLNGDGKLDASRYYCVA
jgi:hypothetical protein